MTMINIFAGCTTREQAAKALKDAQELGVATPEDDILFELVFCEALDKDVPAPDTPSTPNGIKYSVFSGKMSRGDAIEKLHDIDGRIFDAKTYHHKSDIELEQVGILSMLRRDFTDVESLQVIVLGNWVWIDKSSSLPRNIQLRLENCGFKYHAQRNRHYWKSKRERSRFARRMSNAELDNKYSSK